MTVGWRRGCFKRTVILRRKSRDPPSSARSRVYISNYNILSNDQLDKQNPHASRVDPGGCVYDGGKHDRKTKQRLPHVVRRIDRPKSLNPSSLTHQIASAAKIPRSSPNAIVGGGSLIEDAPGGNSNRKTHQRVVLGARTLRITSWAINGHYYCPENRKAQRPQDGLPLSLTETNIQSL